MIFLKELRQLVLLESIETELEFIRLMSVLMILTAFGVLLMLTTTFVAPYGRYSSASWGFLINARVAWFIQELPAFAVAFVLLLMSLPLTLNPAVGCSLLFIIHYFQRTFIYSLLIRGGKPTPFVPFGLAFVFCAYNGFMQARHLLFHSPLRNSSLSEPHFIIGAAIFLFGLLVNIHSDSVIRNLRKPGETGYKIPRGGAFEFVSGANFFGEIVEWGGFALACWSLPALSFFIFTLFNIGPRAVSHHKWYLGKFEDYPKSRKALIPFIF